MATLNHMRSFMHVARLRSFTLAANELGAATASISRNVSELERNLQKRLLDRSTRRITLTAAGERFLLRCDHIMAAIEAAELDARGTQANAEGKLRIHAMIGVGMHLVMDALTGYRAESPNVEVELTLDNRMPDLLEQGYDVSMILASKLPDSAMVSQRLGTTYSIVCASPGYVRANKTIKQPSDLAAHTCLRHVSSVLLSDRWLFEGRKGQQTIQIENPAFQANSIEAMKRAIAAGMGVGVLPVYMAIEGLLNGSLVRLLPGHRLEEQHLYALYPSRQYLDAKMKSWLDVLRRRIPVILAAHESALQARDTADS